MITVNGKPKAEHIHIMETIIGRKIKGRGIEIVHHKDGNKLNNSPENLEVMDWGKHTTLHHTKNKSHEV